MTPPVRKTLRTGAWLLAALLFMMPATETFAQDRRESPPPRERDDRQRHNRPEGGDGPQHMGPFGMERPGPWGRDPEQVREDAEAALEIMREMEPEIAARLERMIEQNPERMLMMLNDRFPRLRAMLDLRKLNPEMFDLRIRDFRYTAQSRKLAWKIRQLEREDAQPLEIEQAEADLRDLVIDHFEVRQQIREKELEQLEAELERLTSEVETLRNEIQDRSTDQSTVIDSRVDELLERDRVEF
ncbi:MAG: hypothetical protein RLN76_11425 [Phycisphaeraceae bacterium]